jgi:hypothetical protein
MAHDGIDGDLVLGFAADGLEGMPQRVEIPVPVDAQGVKQLAHFLADRVVLDLLVPAPTLGGDNRNPRSTASGSCPSFGKGTGGPNSRETPGDHRLFL